MDLGLKDRVAIITGGSRGIGKACAKELLAEGACAVLVSKDPAGNAAAVCELGKLHPGCILGVAADLADRLGDRGDDRAGDGKIRPHRHSGELGGDGHPAGFFQDGRRRIDRAPRA